MSHDEAFAAHQARKREAEAATVRVTWKRAKTGEGRGTTIYSGLGPGGQLVYAERDETFGGWMYGRTVDGEREYHGRALTLTDAKQDAERLLQPKGQRC